MSEAVNIQEVKNVNLTLHSMPHFLVLSLSVSKICDPLNLQVTTESYNYIVAKSCQKVHPTLT